MLGLIWLSVSVVGLPVWSRGTSLAYGFVVPDPAQSVSWYHQQKLVAPERNALEPLPVFEAQTGLLSAPSVELTSPVTTAQQGFSKSGCPGPGTVVPL